MGPLPEERVSCSPAFAYVGTDFAGPLYVKEGSTIQKVYVCLFTCASSRMIHLELTHSLTTDEFLQAFSRMTSRRGLCHTVWSDNAKPLRLQARKSRNCVILVLRVERCGIHWIEIELILSCRRKGLPYVEIHHRTFTMTRRMLGTIFQSNQRITA